MTRDLETLELRVKPTLKTLMVDYNSVYLTKDSSFQLVAEAFGTIICGIDRSEYTYIDKVVEKHYPDYRKVFCTVFDNPVEMRDSIIWALMAGGYMRWVRFNYKRQFTNLIVMENFGSRIIAERLKRWKDAPRYRAFIEDNMEAKNVSASYLLAIDPGFFDYMPEDV